MNFFFAPAYEGYFGNAILSKYKISDVFYKNIEIKDVETRGFIVSKFHENFNLIVTHLDVELEEIRIQQYKEIKKNLNFNELNILLGDFNALRFEDYTKKKWNEILKIRKKNFWEFPKSNLIHLIEKDFIDIWSKYDKIQPTCRYDTRIDYIFLSKMNQDDFEIKSILRIDDIEISDHYPILLKFLIKK